MECMPRNEEPLKIIRMQTRRKKKKAKKENRSTLILFSFIRRSLLHDTFCFFMFWGWEEKVHRYLPPGMHQEGMI